MFSFPYLSVKKMNYSTAVHIAYFITVLLLLLNLCLIFLIVFFNRGPHTSPFGGASHQQSWRVQKEGQNVHAQICNEKVNYLFFNVMSVILSHSIILSRQRFLLLFFSLAASFHPSLASFGRWKIDSILFIFVVTGHFCIYCQTFKCHLCFKTKPFSCWTT